MLRLSERPVSAVLLQRSIDLRQLYRRAARGCEPGLRMVLDDNAQTLALLIADLRKQGAGPAMRGSWRGVAWKHLAGWMVQISGDRERVWIRLLAQREKALLRDFEQAVAAAGGDGARQLQRQLPRLYGIHLDMDSLAGPVRY